MNSGKSDVKPEKNLRLVEDGMVLDDVPLMMWCCTQLEGEIMLIEKSKDS